jgi:hypothetical protein
VIGGGCAVETTGGACVGGGWVGGAGVGGAGAGGAGVGGAGVGGAGVGTGVGTGAGPGVGAGFGTGFGDGACPVDGGEDGAARCVGRTREGAAGRKEMVVRAGADCHADAR